MSDELHALIDALPGNVFTADAAANRLEMNADLLRFTGLSDQAGDGHLWLDAVDPGDLVDGSLVWTPVAPGSPVSVSAFTVKAPGGEILRLRVLAAPMRAGADNARRWIGAFFHESDAPATGEHVARAILERIAAIGGHARARPASIAPFPVSNTGRRIPPGAGMPLAIIAACEPDDAERLDLLLGIFGWRTVVADRVAADLARAANILFVGHLANVPDAIVKPYSRCPAVVVVGQPAGNIQTGAIADGCHSLPSPIAIDDAERLIGELSARPG